MNLNKLRTIFTEELAKEKSQTELTLRGKTACPIGTCSQIRKTGKILEYFIDFSDRRLMQRTKACRKLTAP